ncbi:MAG: PKD domain-containing protein, partial [Promethearchaeota archaeon]
MYYVGSTVSVDATTTEVGWKLDHWSLDSINVGDSNPYMVLMDTDHILTAVFVEAPQSAPIASFVPSHQTRLVNEPVSFDASNSSDPDGNIVSYDWTFGDTSTGSGKTTTHAYQETGDYPVTLTVTDNDDLTDTATTNIHVTDKPVTPGDDVTPPMGSMTINGGVADTNSLSVTLQLLAEDPESGIAYMRFSNDNNFWTEWEEYATSKSWNLEPGEGTKEVYVQFQNNVHLDSDIYSDTIVFASEKSESSLSVSVSPTTLTVGENTSISGILSPPLEGTSVKLECRTNGGTWATIETVTTDSDGGYLYVWTPTTAGTYEMKVSWEGDENTLSCQNIGQLITTKLSVPAAFPLWIFAPVGGGISGVTAILVYLRRRKSKQKQISGVSEIPLPKQKIKKVISPEELKKLPNLPAKCDNTILALNNYIEDPSLANDREAWEVLKELITASEKIDEEYAELFEIRNTIARLRRERNYSKKAGLETDASKYTAYIQSNYQDLIRIIKKIRKKFINLGG